MTLGARLYVQPPVAIPSSYGLLQAADIRDSSDPHWRGGVQWQDVCGTGGTTFEYCITSSPSVTGAPPAKVSNASRQLWGATPFTVYAEIDCSPPGFWDDMDNLVEQQMARIENWQVERAFWTGTAAGVANVVLPHLASNAQILDPSSQVGSIILQQAATSVTGVALSPAVALGAVEQALANCYKGLGIIHVPLSVITVLAGNGHLMMSGGRITTWNGTRVVAGQGYPGTGPDGSTPPFGQSWIYGTGPVFGYRGQTTMYGPDGSYLIRSTNTLQARAERTYLLGYDCCLVAALVSPSTIQVTVP